ncbi:MAG: dibenzothiophene desulfurase [Cereibacter sphaeroides]|uniref:Dibenzothiophene desulfurase n=1 Tax=Cereibacter sphaeroides TaxID=1063 RepID=A0A2W5TXY0_CERSP|nr:MAG: dibenzothiophene desulfurase [Cereibacter sphaeroides]
MHPAPSVIVFTVLSGLGFGFLAYLNIGLAGGTGIGAFVAFAFGAILAVAGLLASTFHLGRPDRAWRAFTQWRTSWLSREGWVSCAALFASLPVALGVLGGERPGLWGVIAAVLCLGTVFCTSMIYAQLKTVPRWNNWTTPVVFMLFALTGGAIIALLQGLGIALSVALAAWQAFAFYEGDKRFRERGATLGTATGLGEIGSIRVFEQPHTGSNYLMREMIHVVGRKHSRKLRVIAVVALALPALLMAAVPGFVGVVLALICHLLGAFVARWLFFAEAEHVVGLYYGMR